MTGLPAEVSTARRKYLRIHPVVHNGSPALLPRTFQNLLANAFADANHSPRRSIHALGNPPAPFAGSTTDLLRRKHVEAVHRNHIRYAKFRAQKHGSMSTGQRRMGVDQVNPFRAVQFPYSSDDASEQKYASGRKSKASRQREIPKKLSLRGGIARAESRTIERLNGKYRIPHPSSSEPIHWFRDEASLGGILVVRVKRREGQDVKIIPSCGCSECSRSDSSFPAFVRHLHERPPAYSPVA